MEKQLAEQIMKLALESSQKLNEIAILSEENSSHEEFLRVRKQVAYSIAAILEEVLEPIYKEHPDLIPY
ncbi:MAG: hypothetical protein AAGB32_00560 [Pseudomonadota bacterium]